MSAAKKIAFLGPEGTHSHRALLAYAKQGEVCAASSISEIFSAVASGSIEAGFVPLENVIEGTVNETLDQLLRFRKEVFIDDSFLFSIEHALGGTNIESIENLTSIYSHPQAIGQCNKFLQEKCRSATLCAVSSTSGAIELVKNQNLENAGVIAHAETLEESGFSVLAENISDSDNNQTRFVLIKKGQANLSAAAEPGIDPKKSRFVTSILVHPGKDRRGLLHEILELISVRFRVNLCSINSRPDAEGGYVFYLELEGHPSNPAIKDCLAELERYADVVTDDTVEISVFGSYQREIAQPLDDLTIGVIGGEGRMGQLFSRFFSEAGYNVLSSDKGTNLTNIELAKESDVVVLSIPMESIAEVCGEIGSALKPGSLVIENCSVKENALQTLEDVLPEAIEILGLHTLFGSSLDSVDGQNIIVTRSERSAERASLIESLFYKSGARITHLSSENHDSQSAVMQSLVHSILVSFGSIAFDSGITRAEHDSFSTPNSRALFHALERVSGLSDELLADLQLQNPKSKDVRANFVKLFSDLAESLNKDDTDLLIECLKKSRKLTNRD